MIIVGVWSLRLWVLVVGVKGLGGEIWGVLCMTVNPAETAPVSPRVLSHTMYQLNSFRKSASLPNRERVV